MHLHIKDDVTLMRILSVLIGKHGHSGPHRVRGDLGSRPSSPASVEGGQASHAPSISEQGQAARSAMDIL